MHVFVTGATGFVGPSVVSDLLANGHTVLALSRSAAGNAKLTQPGITIHPGHLEDLESLRSGAKQTDATIHVGFIHDWARFAECCAIDARAIEAMGEALKGTKKPLVICAGTMSADRQPDHPALETDAPLSANPRTLGYNAATSLATQGVYTYIVRLPPSTYGKGDIGFVPMLIDIAKSKGSSAYINEGLNRWPSCHRNDAATVFRLVIEQSDKISPGTVFHATANSGTPIKDLAAVLGKKLDLPVVSLNQEEARKQFGWLAGYVAMDGLASSEFTRKTLGWNPKEADWLETIEEHYF